MSTLRTTVTDDAGSYFLYENKANAQSDCAKFNDAVEGYHASVEDALDSTDQSRSYIVMIWYDRSGYACTYGPNWKEDV